MKSNDIKFIQDQIGYEFSNTDLLQQAFVRKSYSNENGGQNNEVLEFIGDKVLDFVVVKLLCTRFGSMTSDAKWNEYECQHSEGKLTEIKKRLVQKSNLAYRIRMLDLEQFLIMGQSDCKQNVQNEDSVQEDLFEAIVGAVTLDANWDMEAVEKVVRNMHDIDGYLMECDEDLPAIERYNELYRKINAILKRELPFMPDRAVNLVQELWQKKLILEPLYEFDSSFAENGNPVWDCYCTISIDEDPENYVGDHLRAVSKTEGKKLAALWALKTLYKKVSFIDNAFEDATPDRLSVLYDELEKAKAEHDKALRTQTDRMTEYGKLSASLTDEERKKFVKEIPELNAESQRALNNVTDIQNKINLMKIKLRKN